MTQEIKCLLVAEIARFIESTPDAIDIQKPLTEIGIDSLQGLQLIVLLERKYGVQIEESDLHHFSTVENIAQFIEQLVIQAAPKTGAATAAERRQ
jgi:acyl carrier protein